MSGGIERIRLDDGTVVWARIAGADEDDLEPAGYQDTGAGGRVLGLASGLSGAVGGVVRSLRAGLDTPAAVEVAVSFGIELSAQSGRIVGALAGAGGQATLNVSLTWTEPARGDESTVPGAPPAAPSGAGPSDIPSA